MPIVVFLRPLGHRLPSGRVPKQGPDWFLVATEACGGGTLDLGFFLGVSILIEIFGVGTKSGGPRGDDKDEGRALHPRGPLVAPPTDFFRLYIPIYPQTIEDNNRSRVPPPQASVATKNLSGALPGTLPEGDPITGGHLHHHGALHDEEGVVHPQG